SDELCLMDFTKMNHYATKNEVPPTSEFESSVDLNSQALTTYNVMTDAFSFEDATF
ncbi:hypothetical protein L0F63_004211, partial [Massospora cicadina]